ncbi:Protein-N(5)-glutamine methyltransferase PrmC, methylates polypeptide chain release factors RF1 and RF2 [Tritonibacter mobilis]|jgi:release factor glutamine methyltransferase|uniref:peptide chain release factor N(5)-glutamine methyltransferase n=1 Tax=Tritonibacter mobilis TaxID=379347 RepID=UPI0008068C42|nr:peptide chain release factor N(5)-glutamine methyltransferase [Tritonibacter mobilis]MEE2809655.1 peptide chain release factor N(5)-glutamine methyltransferase [Pseudomonadota bacterium]NHM20485.1 peptide chain release factor N(5)-glutamine methyltransferase [Tritonibacter mobilis]NHM24648.1 peptide chain release factor N(5)-glutamine methyltransferase [Tritonibacter mobilis]VCU59010.1 Protein-N(5)-glutamine methyltransferase PrmC, methylates polypeptide chain release factors RF1 and RF2 [Tr
MTTTAAQAMVAATARLRAAGVDDPARDARVLLAHAARIEAARVTLIAPEELSHEVAERYDQLISLRAIRVPVSHLIGERDFYGRRFKVSADVLDPRPETETLIEAALSEPFERVLDLGVGSGCILVTLLAEQQGALGLGVDLSEAACLQASANAVLHRVEARADIRQSDWFSAVKGQFDLIVSNPPYIALNEMDDLSEEVREHEPQMALTDGADGLSAYRLICAGLGRHLAQGGRVLVEIGPTQGAAVAEMMRAAGLVEVTVLPDLDGRDRVVLGRNP